MTLKQLTVFVENKQGTVVSVTDTLAAHNINIRALSIAETEGFGILRLIVNDEEAAERVLGEEGYLIKVTDDKIDDLKYLRIGEHVLLLFLLSSEGIGSACLFNKLTKLSV